MTRSRPYANPFRVAIIGSGPAGFYAAEHLFKQDALPVEVDMYDRLPTPYGLVRFGVAPDHEKIKNVTRVFDKVAARDQFRFYGNVEVGRDVRLTDLRDHYHAICFATGAQTDRRMSIPGEDLACSHSATEFVAWYNGHPDFRRCSFDLTSERVAVVGVGNVAVDVARILCRTPEELATTDIADYALAALQESEVREVFMLGRRGPAQAAFTNPEVRELGQMPGADVAVIPEEITLDPLSQAQLDAEPDRSTLKKIEILQNFVTHQRTGKARVLTLRFLVSPVELKGDETGRVVGMRLVKNKLVDGGGGRLRPKPTQRFEDLPVDMVFRSVGYHGVPVPDLPFDERAGIVPNLQGRVTDSGQSVPGIYVTGWIKRGPSGVIGTNKPDAAETARAILEDCASGQALDPPQPTPEAAEALVRGRQAALVSYADWLRINRAETQQGELQNRPRVKITSVEEMLRVLGR